MLAATVEEHPGDWDKHLRAVCMVCNTSVDPSTGFSPFFMMFGRQAIIPLDLVYGSTTTEEVTYHEHVRRIKSAVEGAYSRVREYMDTTLDRQKELYDRRVHGEEFNVGGLVWLNNPVIKGGNCIAHG